MQPQPNQDSVDLKDARVSLFKDGSFVEEMSYAKLPDEVVGGFYSNTKPKQGADYSVEVEATGMEKGSAQSVLPPQIDIVSDTVVWVQWVKVEDSSFSVRYSFELEFNDPKGDNFYYITAAFPVYLKDAKNNTAQFVDWQYAEILTGDLPGHQLSPHNAILFNDKTFDASHKKITGTLTEYSNPDPWIYDKTKPYFLDKSKIHIELHSLSRDAYLYCSSYAKQIAAQDDIYSEPTVIYTNIENGLGIFAGENITYKDIVIQY